MVEHEVNSIRTGIDAFHVIVNTSFVCIVYTTTGEESVSYLFLLQNHCNGKSSHKFIESHVECIGDRCSFRLARVHGHTPQNRDISTFREWQQDVGLARINLT